MMPGTARDLHRRRSYTITWEEAGEMDIFLEIKVVIGWGGAWWLCLRRPFGLWISMRMLPPVMMQEG